MADLLSEQIVKVGRDVHDGKVRQSHYVTSSDNKKLVKDGGFYKEVPYTAAEQRLASKKAKLRNNKFRVGIKGKAKRELSKRIRKINNISDPRTANNVKHDATDELTTVNRIPVDINDT